MIAKRTTAGLATASFLLACWVGCQSPQQTVRTKPGELPESLSGQTAQPRLNATTYFAHGHLLERQGDYARAAEQYLAALKLRPEFVTARNRLGITLNKLGQHAEATKAFELALSRNPGSAYLYNNLGFSLYLENRLTESEQALHRALELRPTFSRARMNRGIVLAKLGRFDEAFGEFTLVGSEADAYYNLAMIQADAGHYPLAQRSLEAALARNPSFEPARIKLTEVAERNALLHPDGIPDTTPRVVMAPTETVLDASPAGGPPTITQPQTPTVAPRTIAAAPAIAPTLPAAPAARRTEIAAAAPTKPGPAVTIAPITTPSAKPAPAIAKPTTPPPAVAKMTIPAPTRSDTVIASDVRPQPQPTTPIARPTPPPAPKQASSITVAPKPAIQPAQTAASITPVPTKHAAATPANGKVADLTSLVRDVTPGKTTAATPAAAPIATPVAAPIATPRNPAKPATIAPTANPADDELIEDEEALENDAEAIPLDAVNRIIDSIQRGEFWGTIWCELDAAIHGPVEVVGGGTKVN